MSENEHYEGDFSFDEEEGPVFAEEDQAMPETEVRPRAIDADDTGEYLQALAVNEPTGNWSDFGPSRETQEYYDVDRYRKQETRRRRHLILRVVAIVLAVAVVAVAAGVGIYVANINARLSENVTDELRDQLAPVKEAGDPFYLLLLGVDKDEERVADEYNYGADEHAYRSDSIMLCRIDPKAVKVTMVSIHRDTLVDLGSYGDQKINAAYSIGGAAYATEVVSTFADVPISHYAEIDLDRFISIVDVIGGVTVDLPVPVYDPDYTELDLPAGVQTLNGHDAAMLCRARHAYDAYGDGDRYRAANQRMVFAAIIKKVLASDPATMMNTVAQMAESVTTDMDVAQILELASQMLTLNTETDIMTGMEPTDGVLINEVWYEVCLVDQWQKMMSRVDQGLSPYDENEGEYDSTAGVAGGVGEEGERAAEAAEESGTAEKVVDTTYTDYGGNTDNDAWSGYNYYETYDNYGYDTGYVETTYVTYDTGYDAGGYDAGGYDGGGYDAGGEY